MNRLWSDLLIPLIVSLATHAPSLAKTLAWNEVQLQVIEVVDGDTVKAQAPNGEVIKIRLLYVDAPEHDQPFGPEAKRFLSDVCLDKEITLIWKRKDMYGRVLGIIETKNNQLTINESIMQAGFAWHYLDHNKARQKYEDFARSAKLGLWSDPEPIEPCKWRKRHRR